MHEAFCVCDVNPDLWQGGAGSYFWIFVGPHQAIFDRAKKTGWKHWMGVRVDKLKDGFSQFLPIKQSNVIAFVVITWWISAL